MFTNPETLWIEILVLVLAVGFVLALIGIDIYRRVKGLPRGECAMCHKNSKKLLKEYHKCCCKQKS